MAHSFSAIACVVVLLVTLLGGASAQTTHVVLDNSGWIIPPTPTAYATWAASKTFNVGDILMFNFVTLGHDVVEVSRASYNACTTTTGLMGSIIYNGPANLTLAAAGEHFYICAFPGHCNAGQKLMINVTATPSTASPPMPLAPMPSPPKPSTPMPSPPMLSAPSPMMPSTPMSVPPPPPSSPGGPNSASMVMSASLVVIFLSIIVNMMM